MRLRGWMNVSPLEVQQRETVAPACAYMSEWNGQGQGQGIFGSFTAQKDCVSDQEYIIKTYSHHYSMSLKTEIGIIISYIYDPSLSHPVQHSPVQDSPRKRIKEEEKTKT